MFAIADAKYEAEFARVKGELELEETRGRNGAVWSFRLGVAATILAAALLLAFGPALIAAAYLMVLILVPVWAFVLLTMDHYDDVATRAQSMLRLLAEEKSETQSLAAFASSGEPFALFLRSFAIEAQGVGLAGRRALINLEARASLTRGRYDDFGYVADFGAHEAHHKWTSELQAIRALQSHLPVVLLGNLRIAADMTADLKQLGVMNLTVQAQDWYPIFELLAGKARLVVFYVEDVSPSLRREIVHTSGQRLAYVVIGPPYNVAQIGTDFDGGAEFIAGAKAVIAPDHPDLLGELGRTIVGNSA